MNSQKYVFEFLFLLLQSKCFCVAGMPMKCLPSQFNMKKMFGHKLKARTTEKGMEES